MAASFVSEVLADSKYIVASEHLDDITEEGDTFLDHHASEVVSSVLVNARQGYIFTAAGGSCKICIKTIVRCH